MMVFQSSDVEGTKGYVARLRSFFYSIVNQCFDSGDPALVDMAQTVIVEVSVYQLIHVEDRKQKFLTESDEFGLALFKRIFVYFGRDLDKQNLLLQKIIKQLVRDVNKNEYEKHPQARINLKLIMLLQFIEELYLRFRVELKGNKLFVESLAILIFLFEQLGILSFDLPDPSIQEFIEGSSPTKTPSNSSPDGNSSSQ